MGKKFKYIGNLIPQPHGIHGFGRVTPVSSRISYHFAIACMKLLWHMHARKYLTHLYVVTPVLTPLPRHYE
jgi:hypothetical protein